MRVRFGVKKPGGQRRTFAIIRDVIYEAHDRGIPRGKDGKPLKRSHSTVENPELDAINQRFLEDKKFGLEGAYRQIKTVVIPKLKEREGEAVKERAVNESRLREDNVLLFNSHWEKVYEDDDNDNTTNGQRAARNEFLKALLLIDSVSLQAVEKKTLRKKFEGLILNDRQRQRYGTRINELLKHAKRDFTLKLPKRKKNPDIIRHVTIDEFEKKLLPAIENPEAQLLAQVLFGTGVRIGEAFALNNSRALRANRTIYINRQMLGVEDGCEIVERIKNGTARDTLCLPDRYVEAIKEWCSIPLKRKVELRSKARFEIEISTAAKKVFRDPFKWVSNHDLRHSYAIHMLSVCGLNVSEIALLLGDSEQTVKDHYIGYIANDPHVDSINRRIEEAMKKSQKK